MQSRLLAFFATWALAASSMAESTAITPQDIQVLRAALARNCKSDDNKYVVLSSRPATQEHWAVPKQWQESERLSAEFQRRSESKVAWAPIDLYAGIRFAAATLIDATFAKDSRVPPGWDEFHQQFPGSTGMIQVSLPAFSAAGDRTVVLIESNCGPLCGAGSYVELRQEKGMWKVTHVETVWIS